MISDYINPEAIANMSYEDFKKDFEGNVEIARHRLTLREAFKELGGKFGKKKDKKKEEGAE